MAGTGLSAVYADFILGTRYDKLPEKMILQVKQQILDTVGVCLAGYKLMEFPRIVVNLVANLGGAPEATIIWTKRKVPAINAALANGACAHALDMDDGHRFAALHPGAAVIPAAIAAAELSRASTKDLIAGIVVGYEVMIRIGMAVTASSLSRGFHTTGTIGPFGAAAAAAEIMNLSFEDIVGALGLAGLQGAGLLEVTHDDEGAQVKSLHPAKAAMGGLLSAILAKKGARGPAAILEGEDGFLRAMADEVEEEFLTYGLGVQFEMGNVYIKFHAACRHTHASIDAALAGYHSSKIAPEEISKISIETYPVALKLCSVAHPSTPSSARFSIPFSVALALIKNDAGADKYSDENIRDARIQSLAGKVQLSKGGKWEKFYPEKRGATVSITSAKGEITSAEVGLAKGEPDNPASWEDIYNKFCANATLLISEDDAEMLGDIIMNLENVSLGEFVQLI